MTTQAQTASVACDETSLVTAANAAGVNGPAGLPIITTPITFEGNANTITRAGTAAAFRIAQVSSTGGITLKAVTLSGSHLSGNAADGLGGAIYSTGTPAAATFTSSTDGRPNLMRAGVRKTLVPRKGGTTCRSRA